MRSSTKGLSAAVALLLGTSVPLAVTPVAAQAACADPTGPADRPAVTGGDMALAAPQPGPAPAATPVVCWRGASGDAILGARVVVVGELAITLSSDGELVAFPPDGDEVFRVPVTGFTSTLPGGHTTDGERVYVGVPDGVVALEVADGSEVWRVPIETTNIAAGTGAGRPAVVDGRVFVVTSGPGSGRSVERALVALDATDGTELWRQPLAAELPAGPIAADSERIVVWDGGGTVRAYEPATGAELWATGIDVLGIVPAGLVAMADGFVATILAGGDVVVLAADDGRMVWRTTPDPAVPEAVTIIDGTLLVNAVTTLSAYDVATGEARWSARIQDGAGPFLYEPVPAVVDGLIILGTDDVSSEAELVAWDLASGEERWRVATTIFGAILSPVVSGGRVYAPAFDVNQEGGLLAFGTPAAGDG